jgi:hypothetical protein
MRTPTYTAWNNMIARCYRPSFEQFKDYGGRGIRVCDAWRTFKGFYADMGSKPAGLTLDRIDNDGNYEPGNCRWVAMAMQQSNRRNNRRITFAGKTMTVARWSRETGISEETLRRRVLAGMPAHEVLRKRSDAELRYLSGSSLRGKQRSEETRAKISVALRGKTKSPEHRAKISAARKGRCTW